MNAKQGKIPGVCKVSGIAMMPEIKSASLP